MASQWLQCTHPLGDGCVQLAPSPEELWPNMMYMPHGTANVNGTLDDPVWVDPCWIDLNLVYDGEPCDVTSAKFAVCWGGPVSDPCSMIYAAVIVDDSYHELTDEYEGWDWADAIEVYSQGDDAGGTGWTSPYTSVISGEESR